MKCNYCDREITEEEIILCDECLEDGCFFCIDDDTLIHNECLENKEFIKSMNPNDPADAWFFED